MLGQHNVYGTYNIRDALPQIKPLKARQRCQGPCQRIAAFQPQLIVPSPRHGNGILRHAARAIRSPLDPLGPSKPRARAGRLAPGALLGLLRVPGSSLASIASGHRVAVPGIF
jgi:hypothetical protein